MKSISNVFIVYNGMKFLPGLFVGKNQQDVAAMEDRHSVGDEEFFVAGNQDDQAFRRNADSKKRFPDGLRVVRDNQIF